MRHTSRPVFTIAAIVLLASPGDARGQDSARAVADGGIFVSGWAGRIDANEVQAGQKLENAKFAADGNGFRITTGPAVTYWNTANRAAGNYTVKATFTESNYMGLNNHPHPYGIVVGGNDLGTDQQSYLYCAAYGNGNFIVRGFGPAPFRVNGQRGEPNAAVNKAAGKGSAVTQEIAVSVRGDKVECAINGTVVGSYAMADVVGAGKLKATNGSYGLRFGHNTDAVVTGLTVIRPMTKE